MAAEAQHSPIRVLVADSQAVIRSGVRLAIDEQPDMRFAGEAEDWPAAAEAIESLRPGVAIVELGLSGVSPAEAARTLAGRADLAVLFLAGCDDAEGVAAALAEGARAVLSKNAPMAALLDAIRSAEGGGYWRPPGAEARLGSSGGDSSSAPDWPGLTARERDVAGLVAQGLAYRDVASRLGISDHTVKNHLRRIYDKLDINSRVELAVHGAGVERR